MAIRERRYNPGVATAALLMAPHAAAGGWLAWQELWARGADRPLPWRLRGLRSDRITETLGYAYGDEVIHRDNMVLL